MRPSQAGPTRTADPRPPDHFPSRGNYRSYLMFGLGSSLMLLVSANLLRVVKSLGDGERAFDALLESFAHPLYLGFHLLAFVWLSWVALHFFALFPKTQPFRIGPFKRPPDALLVTGLRALFLLSTLLVTALLLGVL